MADQTGIQWCDATFNPWVGCEKVSPGCAHCYAETLVTGRMARPGTWGADGVRERTSESNWRKPLRWAKLARDGRLPNGEPNVDGHRPRIFCASLADVFEERAELDPWRRDLFDLIEGTPELDWLVLTKRAEHARDWLRDWNFRAWSSVAEGPLLPNVWLGVSIENARHAYRADVLREIPAAVRFISVEPLLGSLYAPRKWRIGKPGTDEPHQIVREPLDLSGIDWVIVGGESGPGARPFHLEHAREIIRAAHADDPYGCYCDGHFEDCVGQCHTAVFVKQLGAEPIQRGTYGGYAYTETLNLRDRKGGDWDEWPADLRVREFPKARS